MEHGNPFFHHVQHVESSSDSNTLEEGNSSPTSGAPNNPNNGGAGNEEQPTAVPHFAMPEEDLCFPRDKVIRIMQQVLPPDAKISNDAQERIQKCVSKFISFVTSEANKQKQYKSEQRNVLTVEDLLLAMEKLGLNYYVEPLIVFHDRYLQNEANRSMGAGVSVPVLQSVANDVMPLPIPPPQQSIALNGYGFPATPSTYPGMFDSIGIGELYKDGSNAGGSNSGNTDNFNPFIYLNLDHLSDD